MLYKVAKAGLYLNFQDDDFSFLYSLPNVDAEKLTRLKNRLVNKQSNGLNSAPSFMGYEEFFKEFISVSSNYVFNRHLTDIFIAEISELNSSTFITNDYEDPGIIITDDLIFNNYTFLFFF